MPSDIRTTETPGPTITSSGTNSDGSRLITGKMMQGKMLRAESGDTLGTIDDTVVDPETGRIVYYIIRLQGTEAGPHPVPAARLAYDHALASYVTDLSRDQVESAPAQHESWHEDREWQVRSHKHYGVQPYWPDNT